MHFKILSQIRSFLQVGMKITLPETNMAPENWWLEDVFPIGNAYFQGLC